MCCLLVIFDHSWKLSGANTALITGLSSTVAVPVFFILSGFWVTRSFLNSSSLKQYIGKRCKKIFPQYILVVVLCAFLFVFFSDLRVNQYFSSPVFFKYLLANVFTLNFLCPDLPGVETVSGINGALWTIKIELGFYIILPVILFVIYKLSTQIKNTSELVYYSINKNIPYKRCLFNTVCVVLYVLSVCCMIFFPLITNYLALPDALNNQLPSLFCYFAAGMLCLENLDFLLKKSIIFFPIALSVSVLYLVFKWQVVFVLFPLALAITVITVGFKITIFPQMRDFSYGMYLTHFPIINVLCTTDIFSVHPFSALLLVCAASFSCAYFMETVFQKYLESLFKN